MNLTQTATATTIDASAPASFTCADCPFARHIDGNRYCCSVSQTASDVKRGHWEATVSCFEALAKAEAEKTPEPVAEVVEMAIAKTDAPAPATPKSATPSKPVPVKLSAPKTAPTAATTSTAAIGTDDDTPPNRGDNGRRRVQPIAPKKLNKRASRGQTHNI